jgi:hypothetical protein
MAAILKMVADKTCKFQCSLISMKVVYLRLFGSEELIGNGEN